MSDDVDQQLEEALRREAALAGVLRAVADHGDDVEAILSEIANHAAAVTDASAGAVFIRRGEEVHLYADG